MTIALVTALGRGEIPRSEITLKQNEGSKKSLSRIDLRESKHVGCKKLLVRVVGEGRMRKRHGLIIGVVIDNRLFLFWAKAGPIPQQRLRPEASEIIQLHEAGSLELGYKYI